MLKKIFIVSLIISILAILFYFLFFEKDDLKGNFVAIVNKKAINVEDFKAKLSDIKNNYKKSDLYSLSDIKNTILKRLIIDTLIIQEADLKNINVTNEEVKRYANSIKNNIDPQKFGQLLVEEFITEDAWFEDLRKKLIIEKCLSKVIIEKVKLTENEIENYYTNYYKDKITKPKIKIAQIFNPSKNLIEEALDELKDGNLFTDVVKKYSISPEAENGGYLGEISKNTNIDVFDIAFNMSKGEVSDIIQSDYGYHIIKLIDIIPASTISFIDSKPYIFNEIINQKEKIIYEKWLENKLKNSKILINKALLESIN